MPRHPELQGVFPVGRDPHVPGRRTEGAADCGHDDDE